MTVVVQAILGKRGLFTYNVWHNRVAVSAEDSAFGTVQVTWNDKPVTNLYISTVELRNESFRDYQDVAVKVWSSTTLLLTEQTELVGTTSVLRWTSPFSESLAIAPGADATAEQLALIHAQREFLVPTMNRGQVVRLTFLNAATTQDGPSIWLDVVHPGVRAKFRTVAQQFMGVPQPAAALVGSLFGIVVVVLISQLVQSPAVAATLGLVYGITVLVPGALTLKAWRRARQLLSD